MASTWAARLPRASLSFKSIATILTSKVVPRGVLFVTAPVFGVKQSTGEFAQRLDIAQICAAQGDGQIRCPDRGNGRGGRASRLEPFTFSPCRGADNIETGPGQVILHRCRWDIEGGCF